MRSLLVFLSVAVALSSAQYSSSVDLSELEAQDFILPNGLPYRDLLTIGASQAVAEFATRNEAAERNKVGLKN